nr:hypothetical protein [Spiroplasma sp. Moj]
MYAGNSGDITCSSAEPSLLPHGQIECGRGRVEADSAVESKRQGIPQRNLGILSGHMRARVTWLSECRMPDKLKTNVELTSYDGAALAGYVNGIELD